MRKPTAIVLAFLLSLSLAATVLANETITLKTLRNSEKLQILIENGLIMAPVRDLVNGLGISLNYKNGVKKIILENDNNIMTFIPSSNSAYVNGVYVKMPLAPKLINGSIYVPLEFVSTSMGYSYTYNSETRTAQIIAPEDENSTLITIASFDYEITKTLMHPTQPVIYNLSQPNCLVEAFNYEERTPAARASFDGEITSMTINTSGTELYVSLIKSPFAYHGKSEYGEIIVLDAQNMTVKSKIILDIDPFSIATDSNGTIFVAGGSNQWTNLAAVNISTKSILDKSRIYMRQNLVYSNKEDKVYAISTSTSPRDISAFIFKNGKFEANYDSQYHGDYEMGEEMTLYPDNSAILTSAGTIFATGGASSKSDIVYKGKIDAYADAALDPSSQYIYAASQRSIKAYNANTGAAVMTTAFENIIKNIEYCGKGLLLTDSRNKMYIMKVVNNLPAYEGPASNSNTGKSITKLLEDHAQCFTDKKVNDYFGYFTEEIQNKQDKYVTGVRENYQALVLPHFIQITNTGTHYTYDYELSKTLQNVTVEMNYVYVVVVEMTDSKVVAKTAVDLKKIGGTGSFPNSRTNYKMTLIRENSQWKIASMDEIK